MTTVETMITDIKQERDYALTKDLDLQKVHDTIISCCNLIEQRDLPKAIQDIGVEFDITMKSFLDGNSGIHHVTKKELLTTMDYTDAKGIMDILTDIPMDDICMALTCTTPYDRLWVLMANDISLKDLYKVRAIHLYTVEPDGVVHSDKCFNFLHGAILFDKSLLDDEELYHYTLRHELCHHMLAVEKEVFGTPFNWNGVPRLEEFFCTVLPFLSKREGINTSLIELRKAVEYMYKRFSNQSIELYSMYHPELVYYYQKIIGGDIINETTNNEKYD